VGWDEFVFFSKLGAEDQRIVRFEITFAVFPIEFMNVACDTGK